MRIYIIDLESVPTRYTCEWKDHIPALLKDAAELRNRTDVEVINVSGGDVELKATPGAFLNFAQTNVYKNDQLSLVANLFSEGKIEEGDQFIFADAWHPGIIQLKYMSELLQIPVTIHALWHAGSYDPQDFLGRLIKDKRWTNNFEKSVFHAVDYNWYATDFHIRMFKANVFGERNTIYNVELTKDEGDRKYCRTGWPMEYMMETLAPYKNLKKRDLILFPHRMAPEKQPDLFRDLAKAMPQYEWVICQEQELTKPEYHTLLGEAKMVFSANLQETLGISCFEGAVVDALPFVPNNLSYDEMYDDMWKYPSQWVSTEGNYLGNGREGLIARIEEMMTNYEQYRTHVAYMAGNLQRDFFSANKLIGKLFDE